MCWDATRRSVCRRRMRPSRWGCRSAASGATGAATRRKVCTACSSKASSRRVSTDRIAWVLKQYRTRHVGWTVKHFHDHHGFALSDTWTKTALQRAGLVSRAPRRGAHRRRRPRHDVASEPAPAKAGDGSPHVWLAAHVVLAFHEAPRRGVPDATSHIRHPFAHCLVLRHAAKGGDIFSGGRRRVQSRLGRRAHQGGGARRRPSTSSHCHTDPVETARNEPLTMPCGHANDAFGCSPVRQNYPRTEDHGSSTGKPI